MSYFRITYKGRRHGYWEDVEPDTQEFQFYYELAALCKKQGLLLVSQEIRIKGLMEGLKQSDFCPLIFNTLDPVLTIHVEYRTTLELM